MRNRYVTSLFYILSLAYIYTKGTFQKRGLVLLIPFYICFTNISFTSFFAPNPQQYVYCMIYFSWVKTTLSPSKNLITPSRICLVLTP